MPGHSYLYRRGAVYWLRRRAPQDLPEITTGGEWKESLRTKDLAEAKKRLHARLVEIDREIDAVRAKAHRQPSPPLTRKEAEWIATRRLAEWLHDDEEGRLEGGEAFYDNAEAWLEAVGDEPEREAVARGDWRVGLRSAEHALEDAGRWYPPDDPSLRLLAMELIKARIRFVEAVGRRQLGHIVEPPAVSPVALSQPVASSGGVTLAKLIADYRADREAQRGGESTARKYGHVFKALEEVLGGSKLVSEITRADCRAVRDFLRRVPSSAGKKYPKLSLREAAEAAARDGAPLLSEKTVASYLQGLSAVFNWGVEEQLLIFNPAKGLVTRAAPSVKRRGYSVEELRRMFALLAPYRQEVPSRFWVPALSLYTGARLGELCQLTVTEVGEADGVAFLDFSEYDSKTGERVAERSLKTPGSERRVPVHRDIVAAGFLTFVEERRRAGGGRLFPELSPGPDGLFSHGMSKWFGRFVDLKLGLTIRSLVFHSFRHGLTDVCREAGISDSTISALGGWAAKTVMEGYGERGRLKLLARESAKVSFGTFTLVATVKAYPPISGYRPPSAKKTPADPSQDGPRKAVGGKKRGRPPKSSAIPKEG